MEAVDTADFGLGRHRGHGLRTRYPFRHLGVAGKGFHLNGSAERLLATIEQSFPPAGEIAKRFAFETRLFQIAAPDSIRLEVVEGMAHLEPYSGGRHGVAVTDLSEEELTAEFA